MKITRILILCLCGLLILSGLAQAKSDVADFADLNAQYIKDHPGKGTHAQYWEPISIEKYWNPRNFYKPPQTMTGEVTRENCVSCHQTATPGAYHAWRGSTHANLDKVRNMPNSMDARFYKKEKLAEVEKQLVKQGLLKEGEPLREVGCIDCHGGVGKQSIQHDKDLIMPDRAACGTCHTPEFAEAEAEKNQEWPQKQWGKGHPSHAVDWAANVENAIWAAMPQREIAQGCDMCHYQQNKCDGCHTRHTFSAAEARQPEACATCHSGVDHNEWENYQLSKHGTVYQTQKNNWNFEAQLKDSFTQGHYTAPTCQTCHFEYKGEYSHNLVRKVRWAFNPTPAIADNLSHLWFQERKEAWVVTCANCHSASFGEAYLTAADKGTIQGLKVEQEAKKVVEALHKDGLLVGQKSNRPAPPKPEKDAAGGFFQLFWAKGNSPTHVERVYADMWEHDVIKLYKGIFHANPGGFTYSEGWSELMRDYAEIMDADTQLREKAGQKVSDASSGKDGWGRYALGTALIGVGLVMNRRRRRSAFRRD